MVFLRFITPRAAAGIVMAPSAATTPVQRQCF